MKSIQKLHAGPKRTGHFPALLLGWLILVVAGTSCRTVKPLPAVDFSQAGWQVRQGQAVWKPTTGRPQLSGDLLVATRTNGDYFVQFTKTPFALATAQRSGERWRIEFGSGDYTGGGAGKPPARFGWFQLPEALGGGPLAADWRFVRAEANRWRLWNPRTGETLEGYLSP